MKAPFSCPKRALSTRFSGTAPQFTATNSLWQRLLNAWDSAGNDFLTNACLTADENGRVGRGHDLNGFECLAHGLAFGDNLRASGAANCARFFTLYAPYLLYFFLHSYLAIRGYGAADDHAFFIVVLVAGQVA